jgi:protein-S-isoprenylcysteine O-methyltransferase Ste14
MARYVQMAVGILIYLLFFLTFLCLIAFTGGLFLPHTVNTGSPAPAGMAAAIEIALLALFGVTHSVMARRGFKRWWTRIVPAVLERSVYVAVATLALIVLMLLWRPIAAPVWTTHGIAADALWALFALGWAMVLLATFLIDHFELFGLEQVWRSLRGQPMPPPRFRQPLFYRWVRHPLYLGFLLAFWAIPAMTTGHLLLALGMTAYILIGVRFEERDLLAAFGQPYADYRRRVGMLVPGIGRSR